jgi:3-oxoacyl-[acyl-carrier-protein] synthase III
LPYRRTSKTTDVDWLIPHQANIRIIEATGKKLGVDRNKVIVTVDRHGNTSAASVPLALDEAVRDGRIQHGQKVLLKALAAASPGAQPCSSLIQRDDTMSFALYFPARARRALA